MVRELTLASAIHLAAVLPAVVRRDWAPSPRDACCRSYFFDLPPRFTRGADLLWPSVRLRTGALRRSS